MMLGGGLAWWLMRRKADAIEAEIEAARSWPTAVGAIVSSRIMQTRNTGGVYPLVRFSYTVGGKAYESGRMLFGGFTGTAEEARAFVAARPKGATIEVRYNPATPASAVLIPEGDARTWRRNAVWLAAIFAGGGLLIAIFGGR
jgi:hypothetical protein